VPNVALMIPPPISTASNLSITTQS